MRFQNIVTHIVYMYILSGNARENWKREPACIQLMYLFIASVYARFVAPSYCKYFTIWRGEQSQAMLKQ